jgi:hypothetical protein
VLVLCAGLQQTELHTKNILPITAVLSMLHTVCCKTRADCVLSVQQYVDAEDPDAGIEEEYHPKKNK